MAIYSTQFAVGVLATSGPELVYTVPDGHVAVLRGFDVFLYTGSVMVCLLGVDANPSCLGAVSPAAEPAAGFASWTGYQVFPAGEKWYLSANFAGVSYILSGYLLIVGP